MFLKQILSFVLAVAAGLTVSSCQSRPAVDWVSTTGVVKDIKGISPEGNAATKRKQPLFVIVSFKYTYKDQDYEGSQTVSINAPMHFQVGQTIALKVNAKDPKKVNIDLPPGPPDRTGLTWRQLPEYTRDTGRP